MTNTEKTSRIYLHADEVRRILDVIDEYSVNSFELLYSNDSGIGSIVTMEFQHTLGSRNVVIRVPITTEASW